MTKSFWCEQCGNLRIRCECPPAVDPQRSVADGGTSGCGAVGGNPQRSADRRVTDLASMSWYELTRLQESVTIEVLRRVSEPR